MIALFIAAAAGAIQSAPARYEGDWYVSDTTDNITGEREVYAFQSFLKGDDPNYVTIRMRCSDTKPTIFIEWENLSFPDQTVLTISPILSDGTNPKSEQYIFQKSEDIIERGLRASPDTSANIVSTIGNSKHLALVAHLSAGSKSVEIDVSGTLGAWSRVSRNCPVKLMTLPPK